MSKRQLKEYVQELILPTPDPMEYHPSIATEKAKNRFIKRVEKIVRSSLEYKDYIQFLKENMDMKRCVFFQKVCQEETTGRKRISIEIHHEPFTLYEYVDMAIGKWLYEGREVNDLLIADEVLRLHYENKVGLVPLSKTIHQIIHSSEKNQTHKLFVPLYMVYGNYQEWLEEYSCADGIDFLYEKLERKLLQTKEVTPETFDSITKNFTYIHVKGFDEIQKMDVETSQAI